MFLNPCFVSYFVCELAMYCHLMYHGCTQWLTTHGFDCAMIVCDCYLSYLTTALDRSSVEVIGEKGVTAEQREWQGT